MFPRILNTPLRFLFCARGLSSLSNLSNSLPHQNLRLAQSENQHAHQLLQKIIPYQTFVQPHPRLQIPESLAQISTNNPTIAEKYQHHLLLLASQDNKSHIHNSEIFSDCFLTSLCSAIPKSSDEVIINILVSTCLWPLVPIDQKILKMFTFLDNECLNRYQKWSIEKQLAVADIYFHLTLTQKSVYIADLINFLSKNLKTLSQEHIIYLLFQLNLKRSASAEVMDKIEEQLELIVKSLSIEEISIIALGFFKTSKRIKNPDVVNVIIHSLITSIRHVNQMSFSAILKVLQISYTKEYKAPIQQLLDRASHPQICRKNLTLAAHLCHLASIADIYVASLFEQVLQELTVVEEVRLKDMARMLIAASKFGHEIGSKVINFCVTELLSPTRESEIYQFSFYFLSCLMFLAIQGVYNEHLLNRVFNDNFIKKLSGKKYYQMDLSRDLATLDCFVELDVPTYTGNRLDFDKRCQILTKLRDDSLRSFLTQDMLHVAEKATNLRLKLVHILPYMPEPVLLLISNRNGCFETPPQEIYTLANQGKVVTPGDKRDWIVVWLVSNNSYLVYKRQLRRIALVKCMHFEKLGFKVIPIDSRVYKSLSIKNKIDWLRRELKTFKR